MTRLRREAEARAEAIRAQAWMTAALSKTQRLPDFRQFVKGEAPRRQTPDEMLAIARGMTAYYAGVYGKPH